MQRRFKKGYAWLIIGGLFLSLGGEIAEGAEPVTVGLVEDVILLPWGIKLPARIDTGAATSSLDARDLTIRGEMAEFRLSEKYGNLQIRVPIVAWKAIRSASGRSQRPVVEMEICLGPRHLRIPVNLIDRSRVKYPLLVGRNVLKNNFVVDCMRSRCAPPVCPEVASQ